MNPDGTIARNFNPRSPHGERPHSLIIGIPRGNFNPRSPHGERPPLREALTGRHDFNPRSPHGERPRVHAHGLADVRFQSTLPARGATAGKVLHARGGNISIHAPRTGSDNNFTPGASSNK